jgi:hypothetical protein
MHTKITILGLKSLVWYFEKTMRHAVQGLHVGECSMDRHLKGCLNNGKKVILMPIYKSFADAIIFVYIHFRYNIETPFIIGNKEDTPDVKLFTKWLKMAGYIYSRRSYKQSVQERYVNSQMLKELIENNRLIMLF